MLQLTKNPAMLLILNNCFINVRCLSLDADADAPVERNSNNKNLLSKLVKTSILDLLHLLFQVLMIISKAKRMVLLSVQLWFHADCFVSVKI